jgi:hypothetical protein
LSLHTDKIRSRFGRLSVKATLSRRGSWHEQAPTPVRFTVRNGSGEEVLDVESLSGSERKAGVQGSLSGLDPGVYTLEAAAPRSLNGPSDLVVISVPPAMDPGKLLIALGALGLAGALLHGLAANHRATRNRRALGSLALICVAVVLVFLATGSSLQLQRPPELGVDVSGGNQQADPPRAGTVSGAVQMLAADPAFRMSVRERPFELSLRGAQGVEVTLLCGSEPCDESRLHGTVDWTTGRWHERPFSAHAK